ncbi:MAG TPA: hypothetical protein VGO56_13975 [Pyrinomonadaceae bacterium]|jgi:hypothetical protein|nr:hypothetical protein [Pyrinomonadaceae bacterium]
MTSHIPVLTIAHEEAVLPNQPFSSWVRGHSTLLLSQIVAILGAVSLVASTVYYVKKSAEDAPLSPLLEPENLALLIDYVHILFIVIAILALIRVLYDNGRGSYRAGLVYRRVFAPELPEEFLQQEEYSRHLQTSKRQLKDFKKYFLWFWLAMFLLYVSFAFQHTYNLVTAHQTSASEAAQIQTMPLNGVGLFKDLGFRLFNFALNNISVLFIFWCYTVLYLPQDDRTRRRRHFWWSSFIVFGLTALFPLILLIGGPELDINGRNSYVAVFDALSGIVNALVFALLIARLDSKLIGLRSWLICILYSYAAVQPLFVVFGQESPVFKRIMVSVLIFVLVSKIYFFLIIIYALQTGRMLTYLFCFPYANTQVDDAKKILKMPPLGQSGMTKLCKLSGIVALTYFFVSLINYAGLLGGVDKFFRFVPQTYRAYVAAVLDPADTGIDIAQCVFSLGAIVAISLIRFRDSINTDVNELSRKILPSTGLSGATDLAERAKPQLLRFRYYFRWFWMITFVLYVVLLLKHKGLGQSLGYPPDSFWDMAKVLWNPFLTFMLSTMNLLLIFWCFVILQSPTHEEPSDQTAATNTDGKQWKRLLTYPEARQKLLIHYSGFIVALIIAAFLLLLFPAGGMKFDESNLKDYATVFEGLTGILSAVALSLLIARLDSKLIDFPASIILILFAYSAIQPLLVVFEQSGAVFRTIETAVLTSALLLKVCFFLMVFQALRKGNLLTYLVCFPFVHRRVDSIFENQFEIRITKEPAGRFSCSIWKKNHLVYLPAGAFRDRSECDIRIKKIRNLMKHDSSYKNGYEEGTHWLRIVDPRKPKKTLCESIALRSLEDAERLKVESIEKIPYCKYDRS